MEEKRIMITEDKLREIVIESVEKVLRNIPLVTEMAVERGVFVQDGINQSKTVLIHIGKICAFEDNPLLSSWVSHWEDEIAAQVIDLARIDVTKDNKQRDRKKKAFIEGFISARLGENFSEYEEKMPHYIIDALEDEKVDTDIIKKIDVNEIASRNKQRIYNYLFSFVELIGLKYDETVKRQIKDKAHKF